MQMQREKQLPAFPLSHLLAIESNTFCFHCNKSTKQWADLSHAIFLCLNCAAKFKELAYATKVRSIGLDQWSVEDVQRMDKGGNQSFRKFLSRYGLENSEIRTKILSKAAAYYRDLLDGKEMGNEPSIQVGRQIYKQDIPLAEMNPDEILELAKEKAISIGSTTMAYGEKGIQKIKQKYESGQLKEGAKKVATTVSTGAKWLWGKMKETVNQISTDIKK